MTKCIQKRKKLMCWDRQQVLGDVTDGLGGAKRDCCTASLVYHLLKNSNADSIYHHTCVFFSGCQRLPAQEG